MTRITFDTIRRRLAARRPARPDPIGRDEAAVAVVLAAADGGLELLLIERAERSGDPWSGQMALPGGRREPQDADLLGTARRETHEETGIALPRTALLGELDDLAPKTPMLPPIVVRPFVFGLERRTAVHPSPEVAGFIWVPLDALRGREQLATVLIRGRPQAVPAYRIERHVVWGMTHRIIKPFLELVA